MIVDDLARLGASVTVVVEGPQLLPHLVAPLLPAPVAAVWLVPSPQFGGRGVQRRGVRA